MNLTFSAQGGPELKSRWRQRVASQLRRRSAQGPRPLAAVTYFVRGRVQDTLVNIRHLDFVILHDTVQDDGTYVIRCAGYSAVNVPWGIRIGRADNCRFEKDLVHSPAPGGRGKRFDIVNGDLLARALNLDQVLERNGRYPHLPRRPQLQWPKLWAALHQTSPTGSSWLGQNSSPITGKATA